jgi:lipopolysaccharide/colanic/teichoic acid biosynthesis glycosyltransferase
MHDRPSADEMGAKERAMTGSADARITRVGAFLRRSRVDELPQMLNILRGEMSWIGPRPEAIPLSTWYEAELPFYHYRHIVRPGITGWAQVSQGHVTDLPDVLEKLHYDFYYIKNFSPWLDAIIFLKTLSIVVTGKGAR